MNELNLSTVQAGRVMTEGDSLYYEVRGDQNRANHPPLLMIPPAGGDGYQFSRVADILADEYRVILYDRRANARSSMNPPVYFEISQQSRDAAAVLRAAGEESAVVLGNSSGAVIALDMAKTQPQAVHAVIAHEAPLPRLLPKARRWQQFYANVYAMGYNVSPTLAMLRFLLGIQVPVRAMIKASESVNLHRKQSSEPYLDANLTTEIFLKHELLPVTSYLPDVTKIKENAVPVYVAVGQWGLERNAWYVRAARILAEQLSAEMVVFPGHHASFLDMPEQWAAVLRGILNRLAES